MGSNPAAGLTIKVGKRPKLRSKGFTDAEATAILKAALEHKGDSDQPRTAAGKPRLPPDMTESGCPLRTGPCIPCSQAIASSTFS